MWHCTNHDYCRGGVISLVFAYKKPKAIILNDTTSYVKVDEIWDDSYNTFNKQNFQKLLDYISGESGVTIERINELLQRSNRTSEDIRKIKINDKTATQNIIVTLGGLDWEVVYLSRDKEHNPILTLWLSNSTQKAWQNARGENRTDLKSNQGQFYGFVNGGLYSEWSANWAGESTSNGTAAFYPSTMYGASYIRAVTLNNGGVYSKSTSQLSEEYKKNLNSVFAKFTMSDVKGSLTDYIVKPKQVAWQENQSAKENGESNNLPNEAWSPDTLDDGFVKPDYNYAEHDHNEDWRNDYIWLPSVAECFSGSGGIWKTSSSQRANYDGSATSPSNLTVGGGRDEGIDGTGSSKNADTTTWMRSALYCDLGSVYFIKQAGGDDSFSVVTSAKAVRPALHFNLKAAYDRTTYVKVDEVWDGKGFNQTNVQKLLDYVTGESGTNDTFERKLETVKTLAKKNQSSEDIRLRAVNDKTAEQDIVVKLGGLEWEVVYLSNDKSGNPILTLWLTNSTQKAWQNENGENRSDLKSDQGEYYGFIDGGLYSNRSWLASNSIAALSQTEYYPSSMYGTSYIRVVTLNNGGQYRIDDSTLSTEFKKDASSVFACFTMEDAEGSLTDYIVKPEQVAWQENQSVKSLLSSGDENRGYNFPNEAWNPQTPNDGFYSDSYNYAQYYHYEDWKDDYIWLPSYSECGKGWGWNSIISSPSIWRTSQRQRENYNGLTETPKTDTDLAYGYGHSLSAHAYTGSLLRSGPDGNTYKSCPDLSYDGIASLRAYATAVRPALHLNLNQVYLGSLWQGHAADKFANEETHNPNDNSIGTKDNPFQISCAEELALLRNDIENGFNYKNKYFIQTNSIMLAGHNWKCSEKSFSGNFDGNGYSIFGMQGDYLFGKVSSGTIQHVNVASGEYAGMIYMTSGAILDNCINCADVDSKFTNKSYDVNVGGLVGEGSGEIVNCINRGNITTSVLFLHVGGLVGSFSSGVISNCKNEGDITVSSISSMYYYDTYIGGLVAFSDSTEFKNCVNYGDIVCKKEDLLDGEIGGIVGDGILSSISNCINYGNLTGLIVGGIAYGSYQIKNCISNAKLTGQNVAGLCSDNSYGGISSCIVLGSLVAKANNIGDELKTYPFADGYDLTIQNCSFIGTSNMTANLGTDKDISISGSYMWYNQEKYYFGEDGFVGESCNWGVVYGLNSDLPLQKDMFWTAEVAPIPDECDSVLDYLKKKGFVLYT